MARAIIRYSFDGDEGEAIRREIRKRLMVDGLFVPLGTGSWESDPRTTLEQAVSRIRWALQHVEEEHPAALDHIWVYIDNGPADPS